MSTNSTYQADENLHNAVNDIFKKNKQHDHSDDDSDHEHDDGHGHHDKQSLLRENKPINSPKSEDDKKLYHDKFGAVSPLVERSKKKLIAAVVITFIFMILEFGGGIVANSLAIMTDAAHLLTDALAIVISLIAIWVSHFPATSKHTFGYHRVEVIGVLISVLLIWIVTAALILEAIHRIQDPHFVDGRIMFVISVIGLIVNIILGKVLHQGPVAEILGHNHNHDHHDHKPEHDEESGGHHHHHKFNLNVSAAFIHVLGDLIQNIGVMIAAIIIWVRPDWYIADPICTFLFSILVAFTTIGLLRRSFNVFMDACPENIDSAKVKNDMLNIQDVKTISDLHIWSISSGKVVLCVSAIIGPEADPEAVLIKIQKMLITNYGIHHSTIQLIRYQHPVGVYSDQCYGGLHS